MLEIKKIFCKNIRDQFDKFSVMVYGSRTKEQLTKTCKLKFNSTTLFEQLLKPNQNLSWVEPERSFVSADNQIAKRKYKKKREENKEDKKDRTFSFLSCLLPMQ